MTVPSADILTPEIRAVVLDLDGTLYAKPHMAWHMVCSEWRNLRYLMAEQKVRKQMRGRWYGGEEQLYTALFEGMAQGRGFSPDEARTWYRERYLPHMVAVIGRYYHKGEWVTDFLAACRARGVKVAVYSDYGHAKEKLRVLGLPESAFDMVVSAPELGGFKPCCNSVKIICERLNVIGEQVLFVGDREDTDGETARAVGGRYFKVAY